MSSFRRGLLGGECLVHVEGGVMAGADCICICFFPDLRRAVVELGLYLNSHSEEWRGRDVLWGWQRLDD